MHYINHFTNITKPITNFLVSEAIQAGLQDPRIGKVLGGFGLGTSGVYLINKSGIFQIIKEKFWLKQETKELESLSKKTMRYGVFTLGTIATIWGIYSIATGILELLSSPEMNEEFSSPIIPPNKPLNVPLHKQNQSMNVSPHKPDSCEKHLEEAKQIFLSCPEAKELWDSVEKRGPFSVRCPRSCEDLPFGAETQPLDRTIVIEDNANIAKMIDDLAFEVNNLNQVPIVNAIQGKMCFLSAEDYALLIEKIEFDSRKASDQMEESCYVNGFWPKDPTSPQNSQFLTFEQYISTQFGHTDLIHIKHDQRCHPEQVHERSINIDKRLEVIEKNLETAQEQVRNVRLTLKNIMRRYRNFSV